MLDHLQLGLLEAWVQRVGVGPEPVGASLILRYTGVSLGSGSTGLGFVPGPVGVCLEPVCGGVLDLLGQAWSLDPLEPDP